MLHTKTMVKTAVDIAMTILLMLLMTFELVGRAAHEWIGAGMFLVFILHHILNRKWSRNLFKGKYTPVRILQTVLVVLALLSMLGSFVSAILISREVFAFLPIRGGRSFGRALHMLAAYWGFVILSLHLGLHWNRMMGMAGKFWKKPSRVRRYIARIVGACIALYGVYAFIRRGIPDYLFLQTQFVFFDFEEPLIFFFLDYLAAMGLFVWIGHYAARALQRVQKERAKK